MRVLLDTHALIWFLERNDLLSNRAREAIQDDGSERFFSHVSAWEIAIKASLGYSSNTVRIFNRPPRDVRTLAK